MMSLKDINFLISYDTGIEGFDVISEFYSPALEKSVRYDRVAGYFSSGVLASAARGVSGLIKNGGKMRLLTSHAFTQNDILTLKDYYATGKFENDMIENFNTSLTNFSNLEYNLAINHIGAMCWMLKEGYLEIKVVIPKNADLTSFDANEWEKFHPKYGIFYDQYQNSVAFSGSVNETVAAWGRNIENFDVFLSWESDEESRRIQPKAANFEKLWNGDFSENWTTIGLPDAVKNRIINDHAPVDFPESISLYKRDEKNSYKLRDYQIEAVDAWVSSNYMGILEMATGTGKTKTAKACIDASLKKGSLLSIVIVPYQHIGEQWVKELTDYNPHMISNDWVSILGNLEIESILGRFKYLSLVVVKNTASKQEFSDMMYKIRANFDNFLLVGDEVHWLGANSFRPSLLEFANFRLGLSATPRRYFDEDGTDFLYKYFGDCVYELTINKALKIKDERGNSILCPYEYNPIIVGLTEEELDLYREFTHKIYKISSLESTPEIESQIQLLLIQRANIAKNAVSKLDALRILIPTLTLPITQTLIYCSDFDQLENVAIILNEFGIHAQQITGEESAKKSTKFKSLSEREYIIENFSKGNLDVLLAIDCLDEGVDIPSAKVGIIMASSGNAKEFIQRRGRLMRPFNNKKVSIIYDFCVLPSDPSDPLGSIGVKNVELNRIEAFGADAVNRHEVDSLVRKYKEGT